MDYFQKNYYSGNGVITLERLAPEENKFSLLFKDMHQKVIGCGFYDQSIDQEEYEGSDWMRYFYPKFEDENYKSMSEDPSFLFVVGNNHFYYCQVNVRYPIAKKMKTLNEFSNYINTINTLASNKQIEQQEELKDQIERMKAEIQEKDNQIIVLEELKESSQHYKEQYKKSLEHQKILEDKIEFEYTVNKISIQTLKKSFNTKQIKRLKQKPFYFSEEKNFVQSSFFNYKTKEQVVVQRKENEIEGIYICQSTEFSTIKIRVGCIKIRVGYTHWKYSSGGDGYPAMHYPYHVTYYFLIDENGELEKTDLCSEEVYALLAE